MTDSAANGQALSAITRPPGGWVNVAQLTSVYALAGGVALAAVRVAYEDFYRQLGTTLDAVGLSSARQIAIASFAALVLVGFAMALYAPVRVVRKVWPGDKLPFTLVSNWCVLLIGATWLLLEIGHARYLILGFAILGLAVPVFFFIDLSETSGLGHLREPLGDVRVTAVVVLATVLLLLLEGTVLSAAADGRHFQVHGTSRGSSAALLDIAAMPVCVRASDGRALTGVAPRQLWLGGTNGFHILFRPGVDAKVTLVPVASVRLDGRVVTGSC